MVTDISLRELVDSALSDLHGERIALDESAIERLVSVYSEVFFKTFRRDVRLRHERETRLLILERVSALRLEYGAGFLS